VELPDEALPDGGWVIDPRRAGLLARARDVWRYRKLLRFFAGKSLQKLYKRTVLGSAWLFIRPLFPLAVNTIVFGGMLGVGSNGVPYFLFLNVGNTAWDLFASASMWGTRSLDLNRGLISRIYVPRLILPFAMMSPSFLNLAIQIAVLAVALVYYRVTTGVLYLTPQHLPWALLALAMSLLMALGLSLWTSVPALVARDVRFTLGYVMSFWVLLTPVLYPINLPPQYAWLLLLNPMAAIVNTFKYGVLGIEVLDLQALAIAAVLIFLLLLSGLWYFSRAEADAADKV
jgi:lipopolysaccharide transport system permease protein